VLDTSTILRIQEALAPFRPAAVYVFGSAAAGRVRSDSDLDLAVLPEKAISTLLLFEAKAQVAEIVNRDVDLIDLSSTSTVLCKEVVAGGRLLYENNAHRRAEFEMYTLSDYARLNEERAPVLAALGQGLNPNG
jgi:predicted nucleotidyltransferase